MTPNTIKLSNAPALTGLSFRHFMGESDYPKMVNVIEASAEADKLERADTVEDVANNYAHLTNCDPYQDMIFAEVNGEAVKVIDLVVWRFFADNAGCTGVDWSD